MALKKKKFDWARLIFRFFGVCLGIILAAYISVGPKWICRSLQNLRAQARPGITATWSGNILIVEASPGSLYLVGNGRLETYIGSGRVELQESGTNADTAPQGRTIVLKDWATGAELARILVPEQPPDRWYAYLPTIAHPLGSQPVYRAILPLIARQ